MSGYLVAFKQVAEETSRTDELKASFVVQNTVTQINFQRTLEQHSIKIQPGNCYEITICAVIQMVGASKDIIGGESNGITERFLVGNDGRMEQLYQKRTGPARRIQKGAPPAPPK